jgi:membrane-bound ClpP family serine protease
MNVIIPLLILLVGLILVFFEFFLPGAILGTLGALFILASIVIFAIEAVAAWTVLLYIIAVIVLVILLIKFALWRIRTARPGKSIYLNSDQQGYAASEYPKDYIGKKGQALSDLKPSGFVTIEGIRWQATSTGAYIVKGAEIEVIGGEGAHLIVKQSNK